MDEFKNLEDRVFEADMAEQRVMLLENEKPEKTASGIYIPKTAEDERPKICTVLRVGTGSADFPMNYKVGQLVLLSRFSGVEVELNLNGTGWKKYIVTNQLDIMASLKEIKQEEKK